MGILSGLLRGVGGYMVEEARAQREAALTALREDRADQRAQRTATTQHGFQMEEIGAQGEQQRETLQLSGKQQYVQQQATLEHQDEAREDQQVHELNLEDHRTQNRMRADAIAWARTERERLRGEGIIVTRSVTNEAGQVVQYNARGEEVSRSEAEFIPQNSARPSRSGRTPARPAATRPATVRPAPLRPAESGGTGSTARVGQIVTDTRGRQFRVGPGGQMIPLGR